MAIVDTIRKPAFANDDLEDEINADFSVPVRVETAGLTWQPSPSAGVMRKRLELVGKLEPRMTTLVKFTAGSSFSEHGHAGGEEFLVLSGIFSDANGDYGTGCYVRNPPGSYHAPFTREGCTILVKLHQFQAQDLQQLVIDTSSPTTRWASTDEPGISQLNLHDFGDEKVTLCLIMPQCWMPLKQYIHGLEIYVYQGSISDGDNLYPQGTWLRYPCGSRLKLSADEGARLYMKEGNFPYNA